MKDDLLEIEINDLLVMVDDAWDHGSPLDLSQRQLGILEDALIFYKEMNIAVQ